MKKIPQSLRQQKAWYVREHLSAPIRSGRLPSYSRYSPVTLSRLRPDRTEDYSDFSMALEAMESHPHWFAGVGIRVRSPWIAIILQHCVQPSGTVDRPIRDLIKKMGGYWERSTYSRDVIQGVLWTPMRVSSCFGRSVGCGVYVCDDGMCELTGEHVPGRAGDPLATDQTQLAKFLSEIR